MEYTIGQIANMFGLTISTLRYYDKEGLFGEIERKSTVRKFHEKDIETLRVIQCLKRASFSLSFKIGSVAVLTPQISTLYEAMDVPPG